MSAWFAALPLDRKRLTRGPGGSYSSQRPGRDAAYAVDGTNGAWWEPAEDDARPTLTVDLGARSGNSKIRSSSRWIRAELSSAQADAAPSGRGTATPTTVSGSPAFRYLIEASKDGRTYETILDKTKNDITRYTEFDELRPTVCRFVRLTITDWPHVANIPLGILECTVFGKAAEAPKH